MSGSSFTAGASSPSPMPPTASSKAILKNPTPFLDNKERRRDLTFKVNGQKLTAVRDVNIELNGNHGPMAEVSVKLMADPTKIVTSEGSMDITTHGFDSLGLPPVLKQLQSMSDEVQNLASSVQSIMYNKNEVRAYDDVSATTSIEGFLWSYIIGKIDEKELTQWIGGNMDNLYVVELLQFLKPLVAKYKQILTDGLEKTK